MPTKFMENYTLEKYTSNLDKYGLKQTWSLIMDFLKTHSDVPEILKCSNLGELYEIGMAHTNKIEKKELGKYYTPEDVATLMAKWLVNLKGENLCDVCSGTGNLALSYLEVIGYSQAVELIKNGHLYLYDLDEISLEISKTIIGIKYGFDIIDKVHFICGDFLDKTISLPENCKVIANPPYFKITGESPSWESSEVIKESKEFYSAIMEKILKESESSVIITPYSFIGGTKFYKLRCLMNNYNGFIVSFDNVPGSIFLGRKHGIFNTNSSNSVRAAITVTENKKNKKGYRCSGLIRFKNTEREKLLDAKALEKFISKKYQVVDNSNTKYAKYFPKNEKAFNDWIKNSSFKLKDFNKKGEYVLHMPNSCRYFTVATVRNLKRSGKIELSFNDETISKYIYCILNSSFCYWHWRIYDGGILYPKSLLMDMPIPDFKKFTKEEQDSLINIANEMQAKESDYLVYKKNAGELQESVKFPTEYRDKINNIILKHFDTSYSSKDLENIHKNEAF